MTSSTSRNALVMIAVVIGGAAVYWLSEILTPLALAIFLLLMTDGLARGLVRHARVSEKVALPAAILLITLAFIGSVWVIIDGAAGFFTKANNLSARLDMVIADVAGMLHLSVAPTAHELVQRFEFERYVGVAAKGVQGFASDAFFVLVYLGFLIASRNGFKKKTDSLFPRDEDRAEAAAVFERIRGGVEGYLWVQTVTGVMIAVSAWVLMMVVGLDNPGFWAFVVFLVCYIPVIGGAVAGLAPPLFALVQFETYTPALVLLIGLQVILFVIGNFIYPRMQGENQNIDPVVILLSLAFWGALWGVTGMFLSTPLTVMAIAILAEFDGTRWIAVLLSGDGEPYPRTEEERARKVETA
ncbi:AI-2E family transporter [Caulobacter sp. 17J65-9]|uniref:AI-2E family transporter n=1 Tax=Caulobacter sp. 17J65-9 TaxID=2709382 RepID=UPI0013C9BB4C|nr:AI-2E family transporter [Caulobacter sp. 17J65-9]NEX91499.1 AI-2E family transporter [Caulobacter sp. 17J65-9]